MPLILLMTVAAVPILDIVSLIMVGEAVGVWWTLAGVLLGGLLGSLLVRTQGLTIAKQGREALAQGQLPARQVFDGACVLFGGGLLMLPGFVSDALGFVLLIPAIRGWIFRLIERQVRSSGRFMAWNIRDMADTDGSSAGPVIEGEFEPVSDPVSDENGRSSPPPAGPSTQDASPWRRPAVVPSGTHQVVRSDNP